MYCGGVFWWVVSWICEYWWILLECLVCWCVDWCWRWWILVFYWIVFGWNICWFVRMVLNRLCRFCLVGFVVNGGWVVDILVVVGDWIWWLCDGLVEWWWWWIWFWFDFDWMWLLYLFCVGWCDVLWCWVGCVCWVGWWLFGWFVVFFLVYGFVGYYFWCWVVGLGCWLCVCSGWCVVLRYCWVYNFRLFGLWWLLGFVRMMWCVLSVIIFWVICCWVYVCVVYFRGWLLECCG